MKKILFISMALLAFASCAANRSVATRVAAADTVSTITGVWERRMPTEIKLFEVDKGRLNAISSAVPDSAGRFGFTFEPARAGFYVIGLNEANAIDNYTFWFAPGDDLGLTVTADSYTLTGKNTPENEEMTRWHEWILPLELKSVYFMGRNSTYEDFFPLLEKKLAEVYTGRGGFDDVFKREFDYYRKAYMTTVAINFLNTPRSKHPAADDMIDYYKRLDLAALATSQSLDYPYGNVLLRFVPLMYMNKSNNVLTAEERKMFEESRVDFVTSRLPDAEAAGEYVLDNARSARTYEGLVDFKARYARLLANDDQRERLDKMIAAMPVPKSYPATDFRFQDINGKEVALSDFKGKVVYIDAWATWCGPCKQQIPYLKKLEAEYHGNSDIVFMSVSTDAAKDYQKWRDMVAAEELGGVQLFGGESSDAQFETPYKIKSIPRFILVGKDGNVINENAPRPSSDEIRPLLNAALAR